MDLNRIGQDAREAFFKLSRTDSETRQSAVLAIAEQIAVNFDEVKLENENDIQEAKRIGLPEDVANMALFLSSACSSFITGQIFAVSGGD